MLTLHPRQIVLEVALVLALAPGCDGQPLRVAPVAVIELRDGTLLAAGGTDHFGEAGALDDVWITRIQPDRTDRFRTVIGTGGRERVNAMVETATGRLLHVGSLEADGWLLLLDPDGSLTWQKALDGTDALTLTDVESLPGNDLITVGFTESADGRRSPYVGRLEPNGVPVWGRVLVTTEAAELGKAIVLPGGGLLLAGTIGTDVWLVALDVDGARQWDRILSIGQPLELADAIVTSDGGYAVVGSEGAAGDRDVWLAKLSPAADVIWQRTLRVQPGDETASVLLELSDQTLALLGTADNSAVGAAGDTDLWLLLFDSSLELMSQWRVGGQQADQALGLFEQDGLLLMGTTGSELSTWKLDGSYELVSGCGELRESAATLLESPLSVRAAEPEVRPIELGLRPTTADTHVPLPYSWPICTG